MAKRTVRIGSLPDVFQYDDGDYDSAIETDHTIKVGTAPVAGVDVVRLSDIAGGLGVIDTLTIINVGPARTYTTVQAALDYLADYRITADAIVRIEVDAGVYFHTAPLYMDHPDGDKIWLIGAGKSVCTLRFPTTSGIVALAGRQWGLVDGFLIYGDNGPSINKYEPAGVGASGTGQVFLGTDIRVTNFYLNIIAVQGGYIQADEVESGHALFIGVVAAHGGIIRFENGYSHHCAYDNIHASSWGFIYADGAQGSLSTGGSGFATENWGTIMADKSISSYNAEFGFSAVNAYIWAGGAHCYNNTSYGARAGDNGTVMVGLSSDGVTDYNSHGNTAGNYSPERGCSGNNYGLILSTICEPNIGFIAVNEHLYVGTDYATIQDALDTLDNRGIGVGSTVTIHVADGTYTHLNPIFFDHPDGDKIRIVGNISSPTSCIIQVAFTGGSIGSPWSSGVCQHGIIVTNGAKLGSINGFHIKGGLTAGNAATAFPSNGHAFGLFAYYGGVIKCGPFDEVLQPFVGGPPPYSGSSTSLIIEGFAAGICASKNASMLADGVTVTANGVGVYSCWQADIEFNWGTANNNTVLNALFGINYDLWSLGGGISCINGVAYGVYKRSFNAGFIITPAGELVVN